MVAEGVDAAIIVTEAGYTSEKRAVTPNDSLVGLCRREGLGKCFEAESLNGGATTRAPCMWPKRAGCPRMYCHLSIYVVI